MESNLEDAELSMVSDLPLLCNTLTSLMSGVRPFMAVDVVVTGEWPPLPLTPELTMRRPPPGCSCDNDNTNGGGWWWWPICGIKLRLSFQYNMPVMALCKLTSDIMVN